MSKSTSTKNKRNYYTSPVKGVVNKKCPKALAVIRLEDRFDIFFAGYIDSYKERTRKIREEFNKRSYTINDTGLSSRVLSHWADRDTRVLPDGLTDGNEWKRFTLIEIIWIKAVCKMRAFGMPLKKIKQVCDWIMQWDDEHEDYPWFEFYIFWAQYSDEDTYIIILPDGRAELATSLNIETMKDINHGISEHLLLISLKSILREQGFWVREINTLIPPYLSTAENKIIDTIRERKSKEITARLHDGMVTEIETKVIYPQDTNLTNLIKEIRKDTEYAEITTHISNNKQQTTEVKSKKRFRQV